MHLHTLLPTLGQSSCSEDIDSLTHCRAVRHAPWVPRLPRKTTAKCHGVTRDQAGPSAPPSAMSATPATQNNRGCEIAPSLPRETKVDVPQGHACHAKCRGVTRDQAGPSAPPSAMSATPAMQNEGGCEIVPRLVCDKVVLKDGVWQSCVNVGVWQSCVWKLVCDKVVCDKVVLKVGVWQSCVWNLVCDKVVCDKVVCRRCVTKLCVKDGVCNMVGDRWCVTKLCVCEVIVCERWRVTKLCVEGVWQSCVWKMVCKVVCDKDGMWQN